MDAALRALNRFGLGARVGEARGAVASDPRGWLASQLEPGAAGLPDDDMPSLPELGEALRRQRAGQRMRDEEDRDEARRAFRTLIQREAAACLDRRVATGTPYVERLVAFWSNHLCVSAPANPGVAILAGHYERSVVRPHVLGRYEDMVLASARHPAMLLFLNNAQSIGPDSPAARTASRRGTGEPGLNENYARELLELHTLGVDGGYDQADVEAAARVLTGWTVSGGPDRRRGREAPGFAFRPELHQPGPKTVLGRTYGPGGPDEGEALIRDLVRHPSTSTFLASKLVRHVVADEPPAEAVERIATVWRDTEGDLLEVSRALVELDEAWDPAHRKLRTPQDWLVAALRALHVERFPPQLLGVLQALRHRLWAPSAPKGYDDVQRAWADPDSLMNRAELARSVAERVAETRMEPLLLLDVMEPDDGGALAAMLTDETIAKDERIALALGGPAFQWR